MIYVDVEWPDIQEYMADPNFRDEVGFDPNRGIWFVPKYMYDGN